MRVQFVQVDVGGAIRHTVTDVGADGARWDDAPAPAVQIYDSGGGVMLTSTAATTGPSTTLSSAASAGDTELSISATTGFERFREVWIGPNADGQVEPHTITGVGSGKLQIADELVYAYSTGKVVKSHDLTYSVSSTTADSVERDCRAEWRYYVGSALRHDSTIFHVSEYAPRINLTAAEVMQLHPRARSILGDSANIDLLLRRLWESVVLPDFARVTSPGSIQSGESLDHALATAFARHVAAEAGNWEAEQHYAEQYQTEMDRIAQMAVDMDEDGAIESDEHPRNPYVVRMQRS